MRIISLEEKHYSEATELYNEVFVDDSDFRPLKEEEFLNKFIEAPYASKDLMFAALENERVVGICIADIDPLVEEKFGKKIAILDLLIAKKKNFSDISKSLLNKLITELKDRKAIELQVHFVDEKMSLLNEFFRSFFNLARNWYYMERDSEFLGNIELPKGMEWRHIDPKDILDLKKWIQCHNEAFKEHYGMRPLRLEELLSYTKEEGFDETGYFGIYDEEIDTYVAECSCEIDPLLNEYKNISRSIIWTVGVIKDYRNKGLGRKLVEKAITWSKEKGVDKVAIHVDSENLVAYNLYSKLGFKVIRRRLFYSKIL